jgi:TRAP-type C4-dicarboxylate transport system permease small subunit
MAAVAQGLVALFAAGILIWGGGLLTLDTFRLRQTLPALGIPKGLVYLVAPISGGLTFIFAIEAILEAVSGHPEALPTVSPSDPADVAAAPVRPPPDGTQAS